MLADPPDFTVWSCPLPLRDHQRIIMAHGGGGQLSSELVEHLFLPAFGTPGELHDSAVIPMPAPSGLADGERLAFCTDSFVVRPLFFPGGCIGDLAVNGTVNDLAMSGAQPLALSAGFILDEGLELSVLAAVAEAMGRAAKAAGAPIVTGDTKVIDSGTGDGLLVNTAGVGVIPAGVDIRPGRAAPGDAVVVSGPIGVHGVTVMSTREGLGFGTELASDSMPLNGLVADIIQAVPDVHVLRDPTRGGLAAALCEIASAATVGVSYDENLLPVPEQVAAACSFLGLDPMNVANEGVLVAIVANKDVDRLLTSMRANPAGQQARVIGRVVDDHPGVVTAVTPLGATRVVDLPLGEQLPRIC